VKINSCLKYWLPVFIWAVIIFTFSSFPTVQTAEIDWQDFIVKKTAHLAEYALLAILIYRTLKIKSSNKKKAAIFALVITVLYAITDEYHQSFVPGRQARIRDVIIDGVGGTLGIYFLWKVLPKLPPKIKSWLTL